MPIKGAQSNWFDFLNGQIPDKIPGEKVHGEMAPLRQLSSEALKQAKVVKESAVAIHLFEDSNDLQIVLTRRNTYDGAHSGQISFPGGKMDLADENLIQTARRESFEEIGLEINQGELIGQLTEIYIPVSEFRVSPFVFFHENALTTLRPDPREVETIFFLPSKSLIDDTLIQKKDIQITSEYTLREVPCFMYQDFMIWGATAILLNELKHVIRLNF
jgi:8-oxo-dGTP pyrophosphatase MutT (NUDIX family)